MKPLKVKEGIYWVGGIDRELRNFHGYKTQRGSTYNAYLIVDEKITLVDTVKHYLYDEMIDRISKIVDPSKIDYVISNHVEMDHSGALPELMKVIPNATVITSKAGESGLIDHFHEQWNFKVVGNGDVINVGKRNLNFVTTPMVHWPDNMVCYIPEEKMLFSNDAFGQHLASSEMFDDIYPIDIVMEEARKYYANIVLPYSSQVQKALEIVNSLDIETIAPSHGVIWRKHIAYILSEYKKWASNTTDKKVVIVYDTMWNSTEKIAFSIYEAFEDAGYRCYMYNLQNTHISDIMTEIINTEYICVGSPTLNKNILPTVAGFLTYMQGLSPRNRKAIAFGSYGWAQQNMIQLEKYLTESKLEIMHKFNVKYRPNEEQLSEIKETVLSTIKK